MARLILDITQTLDGFIAGPGISNELPMGRGTQSIHDWIFGGSTEADKKIFDELLASTGAVILGHRTYSTAIDGAWGGASPFHGPAFVLCHKTASRAVTGFTYVIDGIGSALEKARAAAGDKDIWMMGGADAIRQYLAAGWVDEIQLHISPIVLSGGTRLFGAADTAPIRLEHTRTIETPAAIHIRYKVLKG